VLRSIEEVQTLGDSRRFKEPKDRLQVIEDCVTVTGIFMAA
jgi:hypothetical protein